MPSCLMWAKYDIFKQTWKTTCSGEDYYACVKRDTNIRRKKNKYMRSGRVKANCKKGLISQNIPDCVCVCRCSNTHTPRINTVSSITDTTWPSYGGRGSLIRYQSHLKSSSLKKNTHRDAEKHSAISNEKQISYIPTKNKLTYNIYIRIYGQNRSHFFDWFISRLRCQTWT